MKYKKNSRIKQDSFSFIYERKFKTLTHENEAYSFKVPYEIYESIHYFVRLSLNHQHVKSHKEEKRFVIVIKLPSSIEKSFICFQSFKALKFRSVAHTAYSKVDYIERTTEITTTYWSDGDKTEYSNSYDTPKTDYVSHITGWTLYRSFTSREHVDSFIDSLPDLLKSVFSRRINVSIMRRILSGPIKILSNLLDLLDLLKKPLVFILFGIIGLANLCVAIYFASNIFPYIITYIFFGLTTPIQWGFFITILSSVIGADIILVLGWYLIKINDNETQFHRLTDNRKSNKFDLEEIPSKILTKI